MGGLRGRPADDWILLCLVLLAYGTFIAGEQICRHILTFAQPFCLHVCRRFSGMFRGLFHKQGVGGFIPEETELEKHPLKPVFVFHDRAEAKPRDWRPHWGTASPSSTSCKYPAKVLGKCFGALFKDPILRSTGSPVKKL